MSQATGKFSSLAVKRSNKYALSLFKFQETDVKTFENEVRKFTKEEFDVFPKCDKCFKCFVHYKLLRYHMKLRQANKAGEYKTYSSPEDNLSKNLQNVLLP